MSVLRCLFAAVALGAVFASSPVSKAADTLPPGPPYGPRPGQGQGRDHRPRRQGRVGSPLTPHRARHPAPAQRQHPDPDRQRHHRRDDAGQEGRLEARLPAQGAVQGRVEIHAFQRLPDGLTMIAETGNKRIIEVDAEDKIVKEIPLRRRPPELAPRHPPGPEAGQRPLPRLPRARRRGPRVRRRGQGRLELQARPRRPARPSRATTATAPRSSTRSAGPTATPSSPAATTTGSSRSTPRARSSGASTTTNCPASSCSGSRRSSSSRTAT